MGGKEQEPGNMGGLDAWPMEIFQLPRSFYFFAIAFMIFCLVTTNYSTATM